LKIGRASRIRTAIGFWNIQKNPVKFGKIRLKRSNTDGGTDNFLKPEFWPVLLSYQPNSPTNRQLFPKIGLAIPGRFL
jgi:hypothetical protein